ncbi:MAG: type II toxin-antitoxin system RelE/ParE family toxin [Rhodospirillaceae bacterium]|nr:type II toxin-antitoxin system RelE/ParE family toxin [Rhodospirillaceae bacterium]
MDRRLQTVREEHAFQRWADRHWTEADRLEFIAFIARNPLSGVLIPGTGGIRKIRWGVQGRGKRGGVRVIYYHFDSDWPIFLLTGYAKSQRDDISPEVRNALREIVRQMKVQFR